MMKATYYMISITVLVLVFCSAEADIRFTNEKIGSQDNNPIIGERIDGPANIRDTINGEIIFKLYDNVLVVCTPPTNNWCRIAITPSNPPEDYCQNFIMKGTKILVDGKIVGETIKNAEVTFGMRGYTYIDNIKPETIIENGLMSFIEKNDTARSLNHFLDFISNFQLRKSQMQFNGHIVYSTNENWIEDASPMGRIGLVFGNERLVAILHSRPISISGTIDYKLDRGFDCLVFKEIKNPEAIVKMFNEFVNSVD